jgi:hypothetical protein
MNKRQKKKWAKKWFAEHPDFFGRVFVDVLRKMAEEIGIVWEDFWNKIPEDTKKVIMSGSFVKSGKV